MPVYIIMAIPTLFRATEIKHTSYASLYTQWVQENLRTSRRLLQDISDHLQQVLKFVCGHWHVYLKYVEIMT